jgi:hypothetical protein
MNIQVTRDSHGFSFWPADVKLERNYRGHWVDKACDVRGTEGFDVHACEMVLGKILEPGSRALIEIKVIDI